ncbi:MAG: thioredoxin reductase [Symbiobacteriaceae bacterium]|jgi:thioredoxin reductase (NADPH)|nr:thioredoxin reductase [Symbiobacteriaceae bacterium]
MQATLYTSTGCAYCKKIKEFLTENSIAYEERDILVEPAWLDELAKYGIFGVPALYFGDEWIIGFRPNKMKAVLAKLQESGAIAAAAPAPEAPAAEAAPAQDEIFVREVDTNKLWDVVVIGGGPAGASAALYAARAGHATLVIDKAPSTGSLAIAKEVENYPGVQGVTGAELLGTMQGHAKAQGAIFLQAAVLRSKLIGTEKEIETAVGTIRTRAVIVAAGARSRKGKIPGEQELEGRGVSYCAICDGAFTRGKDVVVFGDNAEVLEEVAMLATFAAKIRLLTPGEKLTGAAPEELAKLPESVTLYPKHKIKEILSTEAGGLGGVKVLTPTGEETWEAGALFLYMGGGAPGTSFLGDEVPLDAEGYLVVDETMATPVEGVFAAGDVRKTLVKQAVLAAADGAMAAINADRFLRGRKKLSAQY